MSHDHQYQHDEYTIRRKVLTIVGAKFHVFDPEDQLDFFTTQKVITERYWPEG